MARIVCSYSLASEIVNKLLEEARRQDRPISWLVRDSLISYLSTRAIETDGGSTPPHSEFSDPPFDNELSLRIDQLTVVIESEPNAFWRCIFMSRRGDLERGIRYAN